MSYFLSVCIPTYNGVENLKYNINKLIKMQQEYNFEICVSDNASDDGTQEFMNAAASEYEFIKYHRNKENLGFAYNFDYVLNMATGEYRWLLGDDDEIVEENLGKVIQALKENRPDICVVNGYDWKGEKRILNISSRMYSNYNLVMSELGEEMSWISSLIIYEKVLNAISIKNVQNNALPHLIEIFRFIYNKTNVYWIGFAAVKPQSFAKHRYQDKIIEYFIKDWYNVTKICAGYSKEAKQVFLNAIVRRIFSNKALLILRARNIINANCLKKVERELKYYPLVFRIKIVIIKFVPYKFLSFLYECYKNIKMNVGK